MTKEQFLEKVKEMLEDGFVEFVMERAGKVLKSGAINLEDYENDYVLPKLFMSAMGEEIKFQYEPFSHDKSMIRERNNIAKFL
jgi:hypothetical protein